MEPFDAGMSGKIESQPKAEIKFKEARGALELQCNALRTAALAQVDDINQKITHKIIELEADIEKEKSLEPQPKSLWGRLVKFLSKATSKATGRVPQYKNKISKYNQLKSQMLTFKGTLNQLRDGDITKVNKTFQKVLDSVNESRDTLFESNTEQLFREQTNFTSNYEEYQDKVREILEELDAQVLQVPDVYSEAYEAAVASRPELLLYKIGELSEKTLPTAEAVHINDVDFLKPIVKIEKKLERILAIRHLATGSDKAKALDLKTKIEIKELAGLPQACIKHFRAKLQVLNEVIEKFNNKYGEGKQEAPTKKEVDKFADAVIALNKLSEEFEKVSIDYEAAKKTLNGTSGPINDGSA